MASKTLTGTNIPRPTMTKDAYDQAMDEMLSMGSSLREATSYLPMYTIIKEA